MESENGESFKNPLINSQLSKIELHCELKPKERTLDIQDIAPHASDFGSNKTHFLPYLRMPFWLEALLWPHDHSPTYKHADKFRIQRSGAGQRLFESLKNSWIELRSGILRHTHYSRLQRYILDEKQWQAPYLHLSHLRRAKARLSHTHLCKGSLGRADKETLRRK